MKKSAILATCASALALTLALTGCSTTNSGATANQISQEPQQQKTVVLGKNATPEEILAAITADFEATSKRITDDLSATEAAIGDTYDSYTSNKKALSDWIEKSQTETDNLFARTNDYTKQYFTKLASLAQTNADVNLDKQMKAWYRTVREDAFGDFYDDIYDDAYSELYDIYYDGILESAFDIVSYKEASAERTSFYRNYSDGKKDLYRSYSDAMSDEYRMYSDVSSEFYKKNYDLSEVLSE